MRNTGVRHHILIFLPSPEKEGRWMSGLLFCRNPKKKKKKILSSSRWKEKKKSWRQEETVRLFIQNKHSHVPRPHTHTHTPPQSSKCPLCSFSQFPAFSAFRTAAVNMRGTADTNQPPQIITAATKQENKYGREERREVGWMRGSLWRVSGAIKRLDAAWNNKNRVLAEVGWGQTVFPSWTETIWNPQICVWLVPDGTDGVKPE